MLEQNKVKDLHKEIRDLKKSLADSKLGFMKDPSTEYKRVLSLAKVNFEMLNEDFEKKLEELRQLLPLRVDPLSQRSQKSQKNYSIEDIMMSDADQNKEMSSSLNGNKKFNIINSSSTTIQQRNDAD